MAMLEFKSYKDDAWFDARVVTETRGRGGNRLRIKFFNFGDDEDEVVHAKNLKTLEDVEALRSRFRKVSLAFQDSDCSEVRPGLLVCARLPVGDTDRKFYDAVLTRVEHKEHETVKGEEMCTCEFVFDWIESGESGSCTVENICRVQETSDEELDLDLICFLNQARERIECTPLMIWGGEGGYDLRKRNKSSKDTRPVTGPLALSGYVEGCYRDSNHSRISYDATQDLKRSCKDTSLPGESLALTCYVEGMNSPCYMVIVENLEKELSPFTIMEFIHQQVSITCQASVSQSKSSQPYTSGIILLDSQRNLDKLSDFLESPDHIIISSTGRPWLMTEKILVPETQKVSIQSLCVSQASSKSVNASSNELDVVISGTQEYMKAKELKNLFELFIEHQRELHGSLLDEERKISNKYRWMSEALVL